MEKKYIWIGIIVVLVILLGLVWYSKSGYGKLYGTEAKQLVNNGCIDYVIDVRTDMEWNNGHYQTAIHLPVDDIGENIKNIVKGTGGVLTYCNTGQRARYAAEKIREYVSNPVFYLVDSYTSME